jgi:predicted GIY-YIG superfamily endonuclease
MSKNLLLKQLAAYCSGRFVWSDCGETKTNALNMELLMKNITARMRMKYEYSQQQQQQQQQ